MQSTSETRTSPAEPEQLVLTERAGAIGRIRLNRPKALNSLTLSMVRDIEAALDEFEANDGIAAILITGEGERGLCAGGDIRAFYDGGKSGSDMPATFWAEEYRMNARIHRLKKPYIALMDGIVMGGGVGVSVYGSHRIVTERTRFAMPETGIGFFPDIGGSWFLSRQRNELGTYAGLTGSQLAAADVITLGLADFYVESGRIADVLDALAALPAGSTRADISALIRGFETDLPRGRLEQDKTLIDQAFAFDVMEDIFAVLQRNESPFTIETLKVLKSKSPLSLKVTLKLLRLGRHTTLLEECLEREFAATAAVLKSDDFYEGIRAAVIDKDRNPRWQAASLAEVTTEEVDAFFPKPESRLFK
ncbi:enoyl-CoA hydratase/isomerase family protein [Rhizobium sp. PAMB 3182]